jgi:indolepyruvate ferredoxin oxidoreductase alpha subunit
MRKLPLLGDEAIAQAAIDAGITSIYAYPGTPSTEITEYVQKSKQAKEHQIIAQWTANEKTAMEASIGVSYAGKRAMTCMKHVGLNVAADPFMNSAITGANGGLVVVSADDPSMHSSQNEQDSRYFGKFAQIPILEPHDQQEAYDMVHYAFNLSEKFQTPVLLRITTRLAHSRSGVTLKDFTAQNTLKLPDDLRRFVLLPALAKKRYKILLDNQVNFLYESLHSGFNRLIQGVDKSLGIIVSGIAFNYLMENFQHKNLPFPILKIGQYPIPNELIRNFVNEVDEVLILEEGYPLIEEQLLGFLGIGKKVHGKFDATVPRNGELNPNLVAKALKFPEVKVNPVPEFLVNRPPQLCVGCPHIDTYNALNDALSEFTQGRVMSDIGCYTLGALPPFNTINSCVDMGASITMAKGASDAGLRPVVSVIGDSTFIHSGITGLIDCVTYHTPITIVILDNETTAMTGGQKSLALGKLESIVLGTGLNPEHLHIIDPRKKFHSENVEIFKKELSYEGVSVVIARRECIVAIDQIKKELQLIAVSKNV